MDQEAIKDFLTFRRMVTPIILQAIFWVLTAIVMIGGLAMLIFGDGAFERAGGFIAFILGPLIVRVYAEILIVVFRMNETLTEIRNNTDRS